MVDVGKFRFTDRCSGLSRLGGNAKVRRQRLRRFIAGQVKHPCHNADHIPSGPAAEAEEIFLVQLQARMLIMVERTTGHAAVV